MMNYLSRTSLFVAIILLTLFMGYLIVQQYTAKHFSCSGSFVLLNGDDKAEVKYNTQFAGERGESVVEGTVFSATEGTHIINQSTLFTFTHHKNVYLITTVSSKYLESGSTRPYLLDKFLYPYFSDGHITFELQLNQEAPNGYVILRGARPVLYCQKS